MCLKTLNGITKDRKEERKEGNEGKRKYQTSSLDAQ